jgi:ubiquinone/menaquinone biosynthesis C-methylase UbiE
MSDDMVKYYRDRAKEYEQIYEWRDPHRQTEQNRLSEEIIEAFKVRIVLDIGCGTGYWTQKISMTADRIMGIDINEAVLEIARSKTYGCPTEFKAMDAYDMKFQPNTFTAALATFWLSHVRREDMDDWIEHMHGVLAPGSRVFIADNTYIEGVGGRLVTKEGDPNTYKLRTLNDGSQHLIVKNYFTAEELLKLFSRHTEGVTSDDVFHGRCFWWISYTLKK